MNATSSQIPPPVGLVLAAATLIPLSIFGIFTNTLTIIVIMTSPELHSTFNYFIVSLCVSDMTSAIISPLFLYRVTWGFDVWGWTDFLCRFFWAMDMLTSYVTSSHILLFASLRFVSIQWPLRFTVIKHVHTKVCIVTIWFVTFMVGAVPFSVWFHAGTPNRTSESPDAKWPACTLNIEWEEEFKLYTRIAYSIFFYIPIILITTLSVCIVVKVRRMRKAREPMISTVHLNGDESANMRRRRKENQMMLQLGLIVGSFLLGYITYSVYHLYSILVPTSDYSMIMDWWFGFIEYLMLRVSECLNPIFYNLASSKMRKQTKRKLRICKNKLICSNERERRPRNTEDNLYM